MHIAALVSGTNKCKWANVSYVAKELNAQNWGWRSVKGTCGGRAFFLGPNAAKSCRGLRASVKVSTATVEVAPLATSIEGPMWRVVVRGNMVYGRVAGPYHRLDLAISCTESAVPPAAHGLIGQSFSGTAPRVGNLDHYPDEGVFTTAAQAEGAIEGSGEMYQVRSPFSTDFAFSLFAGDRSHKAGTAEAAKATCDKKLEDELANLDQEGKIMAIRPWFQAVKHFVQRVAAPPSVVARASSIEVRPGEGLMEAHRRLAESA